MNTCQGCGLVLPAGASHLNEASCIAALRAVVTELSRCRGCGSADAQPVCKGCATGKALKGAVGHGLLKALDWLNKEDDEPRSGGGKRYQG